MPTKPRVEIIQELQALRGDSVLIAYVTSTRPGIEAQMSLDVIPTIYSHLREIAIAKDQTRIDLFIHSNGGEATVPWRLVTLLREFCDEFNVLVPHRAFSAATLTALGADSVIMHPMGMLGPTDPSIIGPYNPTNPLNPQQVLPVSVEDVAAYIALVKEDVGIQQGDELVQTFLALAEKVHPLALGNVKRTTSQSRMLGEKLLRRRTNQMSKGNIDEVLRKLTSELFSHGHPINSREAREDLGLDFVEDASVEVAQSMWELYESFDLHLRLSEEFNVAREAIAKNPLPVPAPQPQGMMVPPSQATVQLDPLRFVVVESESRADELQAESEVTIVRDQQGNYQNGPLQILSQKWVRER